MNFSSKSSVSRVYVLKKHTGGYKMKKIKISLLCKLILAIIIGIGIGLLKIVPLIRTIVTFSGIFGNFL